jgi:TAP-like protein
MAKKFVDAGLIEQKSEGHCSLSASSRCTNDWIQGYLKAGILPPHPVGDLDDGKWVTCRAESYPWQALAAEYSEAQGEEARVETRRIKALNMLQQEFGKTKPWGTQYLDWIPPMQELVAVYESQNHCSH